MFRQVGVAYAVSSVMPLRAHVVDGQCELLRRVTIGGDYPEQ